MFKFGPASGRQSVIVYICSLWCLSILPRCPTVSHHALLTFFFNHFFCIWIFSWTGISGFSWLSELPSSQLNCLLCSILWFIESQQSVNNYGEHAGKEVMAVACLEIVPRHPESNCLLGFCFSFFCYLFCFLLLCFFSCLFLFFISAVPSSEISGQIVKRVTLCPSCPSSEGRATVV